LFGTESSDPPEMGFLVPYLADDTWRCLIGFRLLRLSASHASLCPSMKFLCSGEPAGSRPPCTHGPDVPVRKFHVLADPG
ncbi:hypothetical protein KI387_006226, partial [Taxus chinensis]